MPKPSLDTADYRSSRVLHSNFPADHCCPVDEFLGSAWFPQLHEINPPAMGQSMEKLWTSAKLHKVGAIVASCRIGFQTKTCLFTFTSHQEDSWDYHGLITGLFSGAIGKNTLKILKASESNAVCTPVSPPCTGWWSPTHWSREATSSASPDCYGWKHKVTAPQSLLWLTYVFPTKATNNPSRMFSLEQS